MDYFVCSHGQDARAISTFTITISYDRITLGPFRPLIVQLMLTGDKTRSGKTSSNPSGKSKTSSERQGDQRQTLRKLFTVLGKEQKLIFQNSHTKIPSRKIARNGIKTF